KQNNELLMKNLEICLIGIAPLPEVNAAVHNKYGNEKYKGRYRGRGRGLVGNMVEDVLVTVIMVFIIVAFPTTWKRIAMNDKKEVVKITLQRLLRMYITNVV
ncbi:hypothetical protein J1N35_043678, partial [Gossypium stocksii]